MASEVDICNLALSHIGQDAAVTSISPPDGSFEADKCATFYPMARDEILERHAWRFNTKRATLAYLDATPPAGWIYAYGFPSDCIQPLALYLPDEVDDTNQQHFSVETADDGQIVIYTNVADAVLKYKSQQTDTTKFTPSFIRAVSYLLAAYLCGPITKDIKMKAGLEKLADDEITDAAAEDSKGSVSAAYDDARLPAQIRARS